MAQRGFHGASPYATGGGGQVLEHVYAATVLVALLAGDPVFPLGDDVVPEVVRFQASDEVAVDDLVIEGRNGLGVVRRVAIGVRRDPALTTSDEKSVPLVRTFIETVEANWDDVKSGTFRVGLAVSSPNPAVQQLAQLAAKAKSVTTGAEFRAALRRPGAASARVRGRLTHVDALVEKAKADTALADRQTEDLTWQWLVALHTHELRLEGVDQSDRTLAVAALRDEVEDLSPTTASAAFGALIEQAGRWIPTAARVDRAAVRRALSGFSVRRSTSFGQAWDVLDGLSARLERLRRADLTYGTTHLELPRQSEYVGLRAAIEQVGNRTGLLTVTGDPDTGKSSLSLRVARDLETEGAAVTCLNLRDLPQLIVDLEARLGASLSAVMAANTLRPCRLLIIDGAEAVLEGRSDVFREFATAALAAGIGLVAIARSDAISRVREEILEVARGLELEAPENYLVQPLSDSERQQIVETFPSLSMTLSNERSEWLLGRLGLVDVLLRAGVVDPPHIFSEADVFEAVWNGLVRRREEVGPNGVSGDDREAALLSVARRNLNLGTDSPPSGPVLRHLRSDGLLTQPASPAISRGDDFASDLIRDFALCRLFLTEGWQPLIDAEIPRWAIRSVRLACQALLRDEASQHLWGSLEGEFERIAQGGGNRWQEVPLEALLALSDRHVLEILWESLAANDFQQLKTLLRLAEQRYVAGGEVGDAVVLAPIVETTFCGDHLPLRRNRWSQDNLSASVKRLVLAWLRGLVSTGSGPRPLRQTVRDQILATDPDEHDKFAIEAVATLGPDIDSGAESFLRTVASEDPYHLGPAVESTGAVIGMSDNSPELMLYLAEEFYVVRPESGGEWEFSDLDDGIREHQMPRGLRDPQAAWFYGPFYRMLNQRPMETLEMINRMVDHAAQVRVRPRHRPWESVQEPTHPQGFEFDLATLGPRFYVGDGHVWQWYRGSSVGPYACMSALLAVERFADQLVTQYRLSVERVVGVLLHECHSLAMAGLAYGFVVRHLTDSVTALDDWLQYPAIWHLEFSRVTQEGLLHVQGRDPEGLVGRQRRRHTPGDAAAEMMAAAIRTDNQPRIEALGEIAGTLIANAQGEGSRNEKEDLIVEGWAALLRRENYITRRLDSGGIAVGYRRPDNVESAVAQHMEQMAGINESTRLETLYSLRHNLERPVSTPSLLSDIVIARGLAKDPPDRLSTRNAIAGVAAAVIRHQVDGDPPLDSDDVKWAVEIILATALEIALGPTDFHGTHYSFGADRAAAQALPLLLLGPFADIHVDQQRLYDALSASASSTFTEARLAFAIGAREVWRSACAVDIENGECGVHRPLWAAALGGLADCRLGPWDYETQTRPRLRLDPPYTQNLASVATEDLVLHRLSTPLICVMAAGQSGCLRDDRQEMLSVILDADRRCATHWAKEGYGGDDDRDRQLVARTLVELVEFEEPQPLIEHVRFFTANANALQQFLVDLQYRFSYNDELRALLPTVWPLVLGTALDSIDAGAPLLEDRHWVDYAVAELLPTPKIEPSDVDPDSTLMRLRSNWLPPNAIENLLIRWAAIARGEPRAADSVASFAQTCAIEWQITDGLPLLELVIAGRFDQFANRCWFATSWLEALRRAPQFRADGPWQRLVDGLAAAGDDRAAGLQRLDE